MVDITGLIIAYPKESILIISLIVSLLMVLATKYFTDQNKMKELKAKQKELQQKMKAAKGDMQEVTKINKEVMEISMQMMKMSFKPTLITLIPAIFILWKLNQIFTGVLDGWIWWYIIASIIFSIALRKALKIA